MLKLLIELSQPKIARTLSKIVAKPAKVRVLRVRSEFPVSQPAPIYRGDFAEFILNLERLNLRIRLPIKYLVGQALPDDLLN